jgi:hypothetical protein
MVQPPATSHQLTKNPPQGSEEGANYLPCGARECAVLTQGKRKPVLVMVGVMPNGGVESLGQIYHCFHDGAECNIRFLNGQHGV